MRIRHVLVLLSVPALVGTPLACSGDTSGTRGGAGGATAGATGGATPGNGGEAGAEEAECDCNDGFSCTIDRCVDGSCVHSIGPNNGTTACPAGEYCTLARGCVTAPACSSVAQCEDAWADDACKTNIACEAASALCTFKTLDGDGDGHPPPVCGGGDCNDDNYSVNPGATEQCNGVDDDCDGEVDEGADAGCGDLEHCVEGYCQCRVENQCEGACVDKQTSERHCGECGNACPVDNECVEGSCVCQSGATSCVTSHTGGTGGAAGEGGAETGGSHPTGGNAQAGGEGGSEVGAENGEGGVIPVAGGAPGTGEIPVAGGIEDWTDCGATAVSADYRTPNILLVVDKSGSMDDPIGDVSKWEALQTALDDALGDVADDMNLGLILYPDNPGGTVTCEVPEGGDAVNVEIAPATEAVDSIIGALQGTAPGGGTPTAEALRRAYDYFVDGAGADLEGEKYVLLATDGGPNCNASLRCEADECTVNLDGKCDSGGNCCETTTGAPLGDRCLDDADVLEQISNLAMRNIPTFVVGIPGTEAYADYLDDFAVAGERALGDDTEYYAVSAESGVAGLTATFQAISTQLVRDCEIELSEAPPQADLVNVVVDGIPINRDGDDSGWDLSMDPPVITLRGDICDDVRNRGAERVDVVLGCPVIR